MLNRRLIILSPISFHHSAADKKRRLTQKMLKYPFKFEQCEQGVSLHYFSVVLQ